jgi:parvulin-like peptidyl-prolyl cis-trans isomerase-like protein
MRTALREPLLQFLLLGALLFAVFEWRGAGSGPGGSRIVVTPGLVQHLVAGFALVWQRPPTDAEVKGLIDDYVKEEIATREATAMGLDRDDAIIRRRLRQKLEFVVEDAVGSAAPTERELQAWLDAHPEAFPGELQLSFRQVYLSRERHGPNLKRDAQRLLERLEAGGTHASSASLGDPTLLPPEQALAPLGDTSRSFGADFARAVAEVEPGRWAGPIESTYGLHLVRVSERVAARKARLADVRPQVERELAADRKSRELAALYERLLQRYTVSIEMPKTPASKATASGGQP